MSKTCCGYKRQRGRFSTACLRHRSGRADIHHVRASAKTRVMIGHVGRRQNTDGPDASHERPLRRASGPISAASSYSCAFTSSIASRAASSVKSISSLRWAVEIYQTPICAALNTTPRLNMAFAKSA